MNIKTSMYMYREGQWKDKKLGTSYMNSLANHNVELKNEIMTMSPGPTMVYYYKVVLLQIDCFLVYLLSKSYITLEYLKMVT